MADHHFSAFDIIGPNMIGPSSSHTAGAARLAFVAGRIAGGANIRSVEFELFGSFALTGRGHGTDKALLAGILGMQPDDPRLPQSYDIARQRGLEFHFIYSDQPMPHPNTVRISARQADGTLSRIVGESVGGGNIRITQINGIEVDLTGAYPTVVIAHHDQPGAISDVTRIIAQYQVNIAFMQVFRRRKGDEAYMIIQTDQDAPPGMAQDITRQVSVVQQVMCL